MPKGRPWTTRRRISPRIWAGATILIANLLVGILLYQAHRSRLQHNPESQVRHVLEQNAGPLGQTTCVAHAVHLHLQAHPLIYLTPLHIQLVRLSAERRSLLNRMERWNEQARSSLVASRLEPIQLSGAAQDSRAVSTISGTCHGLDWHHANTVHWHCYTLQTGVRKSGKKQSVPVMGTCMSYPQSPHVKAHGSSNRLLSASHSDMHNYARKIL